MCAGHCLRLTFLRLPSAICVSLISKIPYPDRKQQQQQQQPQSNHKKLQVTPNPNLAANGTNLNKPAAVNLNLQGFSHFSARARLPKRVHPDTIWQGQHCYILGLVPPKVIVISFKKYKQGRARKLTGADGPFLQC